MKMAGNEIKISFLGDIMCEEPFLRAAKLNGNTYDFDRAFDGIRNICAESDVVIGNLETPLAGAEREYTHEMYSFNTPDSFAEAVKRLGVSCVLTANNHCCDRGINGLRRTLAVLDQIELPHTGTFDSSANNNLYLAEVKDTRLAVISCTASTNAVRTGCKATDDNVNLMQEQVTTPLDVSIIGKCKKFLKNRLIGEKDLIRLGKKMGLPAKKVSTDNMFDIENVQTYMDNICKQIAHAKATSDIVFVCPHMGGQFNVTPGGFSEYAMERMAKAGADAIVASHPHIVQKSELKNNVPCFYSIGNVTMSMSTLYILRDELPDYGVMIHFYLSDGRIQRVAYSLIVMDEQPDGYMMVKTAYDMFQESDTGKRAQILENSQRIVRRICGDNRIHLDKLEKEFMLFDWGARWEEQ